MAAKRKVEIFSAGCDCCEEAIARVKSLGCPDCEIVVLDMKDDAVAKRARGLGVKSVPAVAIDGALAACCTDRGIDEATLRQAGLGTRLS